MRSWLCTSNYWQTNNNLLVDNAGVRNDEKGIKMWVPEAKTDGNRRKSVLRSLHEPYQPILTYRSLSYVSFVPWLSADCTRKCSVSEIIALDKAACSNVMQWGGTACKVYLLGHVFDACASRKRRCVCEFNVLCHVLDACGSRT